jgi:trk system potassium uptake protein TrkA
MMTGNKFAVVGMGYFGSAIARILSKRGAEVVAIDSHEDRIEHIKDDVAYAVTLDATDRKALESQGLHDMDAVVVAIGENFEALLLCTLHLQEMGVRRIIARASHPSQMEILRKMGVKEVLQPEVTVGASVAENLLNPDVLMCMRLPDEYEIIEIKAPKNIIGRTLENIGLRDKYNINLVTIMRDHEEKKGSETVVEQHILGVPMSDTVIQPSDVIVIFGRTKSIERFIEINS